MPGRIALFTGRSAVACGPPSQSVSHGVEVPDVAAGGRGSFADPELAVTDGRGVPRPAGGATEGGGSPGRVGD